jgi:hypothetical protein
MKRNLKNFVEAGYKKKSDAKNVNGYILDEDLSTKRNKVYYDPNTGKAVHTIAGTDTMKDWTNNALIPLGLHHYSNRYKNSEKIQKKANEKYGKSNVDLVSHSQSGNIAENLANRNLVGGENTTLNPAIIGSHNKDIKVVKSVLDPVSLLTKTTKKDLKIIPKTFNPITEHSTNILDKTKKNIFGFGVKTHANIQSVLFKRPEWKLTECKKWLKKHGFKFDVDKKPEHYRFRQLDPELFSKYRTKKINDNIEFIIGIKGKSDNKTMKYRSEDESEASSSEEEEEHELQGGTLHEQDIIDRMAKLSHDIHVHHQKHGVKPSIVKGFKVLGEGILHSSKKQVTGGQIGGKINRSKKFNNWFKDIGQKFLPLNKNLSPIKHQMTQSAVDNIAYATMTPEQQMQSGVDMFGDVMGNFNGSNKPTKPADYPQNSYYPQPYYPQQDYYHEMYKPVIAQPVTASAYSGYYDTGPSDFNSQPSSYSRSTQPKGFGLGTGMTFFDRKGGNDGKTHKEVMREKDNEKYTNNEAKSDAKYFNKVNNRGGFKGLGFIQHEQETTKKPIHAKQMRVDARVQARTQERQDDRMEGKGAVGKMLKKAAADATVKLLNSGTSRATHEMDNRGKKGGSLKGSPEMKERMAKMRAMRKCNKG